MEKIVIEVIHDTNILNILRNQANDEQEINKRRTHPKHVDLFNTDNNTGLKLYGNDGGDQFHFMIRVLR